MLRSLFATVGLANKAPPPPPPAAFAPAGEASTSAVGAEPVAGWHVLTIDGYSNVKAVFGTGKFVTTRTRPFTVGGHRWYIKFFPNGEDPDTAKYISIYLMREQEAGGADVSARFRFTLLAHDGVHGAESSSDEPWHGFQESKVHTWKADGSSAWGDRKLAHSHRWLLREGYPYLRDDCVRIRCDVVVSKDIINATAERDGGDEIVDVPPPDVGLDILQLLWEGDGSDVTFEVAGETFRAHRCVLAARSPMFMAELYGPMKETTEAVVRIDDVDAGVFKLLLNFVYTDWLPEMDEGVILAMSQHLLVAGDRYGLDRLKLFCEHNLCCRVNASTVATSLALAEQHGCQGLKKACVQFLKSGRNLKAAMATDGFEHLTSSCPSLVEELLAMVAP